eukprot:gene25455-biopygen1450
MHICPNYPRPRPVAPALDSSHCRKPPVCTLTTPARSCRWLARPSQHAKGMPPPPQSLMQASASGAEVHDRPSLGPNEQARAARSTTAAACTFSGGDHAGQGG